MTGADATRGITLLELVVAVLVLAIATMAALRSTEHATRALGGETARVLALQVALNRAEEYRLYGARVAAGLPREARYGQSVWRLDVSEAPARGARPDRGRGSR